MSFPTAIELVSQGRKPEEALLTAMQRDTAMGFLALQAQAEARRTNHPDPIAFIRNALADHGSEAQAAVLRCRSHGSALKVDFDPLSALGMQISRLLGTDAARPLLEQRLEMCFGFANCCGAIADPKKSNTTFTVADQIEWQHSIDC
ncbi:hypothetical protein GF380_00055 [Candidatus Uhrbacteria bacterium]|nr:hypothetical protein [Candidatus Uhrbacteria bacterium]MBD3283817.1 hypothetical protein [Candidatus Uhrbacteria bacterium]